MSDPNNPGETPAGAPPPQPNPYGQPPAGQDPYGQPPAGQDPYGQPPAQTPTRRRQLRRTASSRRTASPPTGSSPATPSPAYGAPVGDPDKRPGTVTAAGVITMVLAGLSTLLYGLGLVALLVARDEVLDEIENSQGFEDAGISADSAFGVVAGVMGVFALWSLIALILGVLVLRRSNGARITLVVSSAMTILLSLLAIGSGVSAVTLIGGIAVIILLFTGGASDWFKRSRPPTPACRSTDHPLIDDGAGAPPPPAENGRRVAVRAALFRDRMLL